MIPVIQGIGLLILWMAHLAPKQPWLIRKGAWLAFVLNTSLILAGAVSRSLA